MRVSDEDLDRFNMGAIRIAEDPDLVERIAFDLRDLRKAVREYLKVKDKVDQWSLGDVEDKLRELAGEEKHETDRRP